MSKLNELVCKIFGHSVTDRELNATDAMQTLQDNKVKFAHIVRKTRGGFSMDWNWAIGLKITDFYCNGFFGRVYDLNGSKILHAGNDYLVIRKPDGEVVSASFDGWSTNHVKGYIEEWTS